jgi:hypothetical protein
VPTIGVLGISWSSLEDTGSGFMVVSQASEEDEELGVHICLDCWFVMSGWSRSCRVE